MKKVFHSWLRILVGVFLALGCCQFGQTPAARGDDDPEELIYSVLERGDTVFLSTNLGLFRAALSDKVWHRLPLPAAAPLAGILAREAAPSPLVVYFTGRRIGWMLEDEPAALYVSRDSGQTWECTSTGRHFDNVFVQRSGDLYASECVFTPDPPSRKDPTASSGPFTDKQGRKMHRWRRILISHDFGKNWLDISGEISPEYHYGIFRDPAHPDLVRLWGGTDFSPHEKRYEAGDASYHWKEVNWKDWRPDSADRTVPFCSYEEGSNDDHIHADRSNLLDYPFLSEGYGWELSAARIEIERPAYVFRQGAPKPVAVKVYFLFSRLPLRFTDYADETICWGVGVLPEKGEGFCAPAKVKALVDGPADRDDDPVGGKANRDAQLAAYRDDPAGRIINLDDEHPYRRTVDLARLCRFPGPGRYRVALCKTACPFFKGDAGFSGQVIDVTILP